MLGRCRGRNLLVGLLNQTIAISFENWFSVFKSTLTHLTQSQKAALYNIIEKRCALLKALDRSQRVVEVVQGRRLILGPQ
jgi:hypothetical protein